MPHGPCLSSTVTRPGESRHTGERNGNEQAVHKGIQIDTIGIDSSATAIGYGFFRTGPIVDGNRAAVRYDYRWMMIRNEARTDARNTILNHNNATSMRYSSLGAAIFQQQALLGDGDTRHADARDVSDGHLEQQE